MTLKSIILFQLGEILVTLSNRVPMTTYVSDRCSDIDALIVFFATGFHERWEDLWEGPRVHLYYSFYIIYMSFLSHLHLHFL